MDLYYIGVHEEADADPGALQIPNNRLQFRAAYLQIPPEARGKCVWWIRYKRALVRDDFKYEVQEGRNRVALNVQLGIRILLEEIAEIADVLRCSG